MPREIFGDVVDPSIKVGTKQWYTVPLSIVGHVILLGTVVAIPLLATEILPLPQTLLAFAAPPPPPTLPPPPAPSPTLPNTRPADIIDNAAPLVAPSALPPEPLPSQPRGLAPTMGGLGD